MSKKYKRRVSDLIQIHLTDLLERKVNDPRLKLVTIMGVKVTTDAARADVFFSVLGGEEAQAQAQEGLESASGWLRRELGNRLNLRNTPELIFRYDPSLEHGDHIDSILNELGLGGDEERDPDAS